MPNTRFLTIFSFPENCGISGFYGKMRDFLGAGRISGQDKTGLKVVWNGTGIFFLSQMTALIHNH
jgi:hypothetical protein